MDRRRFLVALVVLYGCGRNEQPTTTTQPPQTAPLAAMRSSGTSRIAILYFGSQPQPSSPASLATRSREVFGRRLSELGYIEGKTIVIEERYADGDTQQLAQLARELTASNVDIIVAQALTASVAARQATSTIPIVMMHAGSEASLVSAGVIASLARPGGNVTGTTNVPLGGKLVDVLRELVPNATTFALLVNPTNAGPAGVVAAASEATRKAGVRLAVAEVTRAEDFRSAFVAIRGAHADGLMVAVEPLIGTYAAQVIDFAAAARMPAIYDDGAIARRGGLIAYATKYIEHYPIAAEYVDKILKGANPANLPVQQPARFELVINRNTANALGLTIPESLLQRADEVIQ